ncbi:MAG: transcriptional repressor [Alistipes sp.]|nr:transcriptional repressor [Alistipes sp.]
MKTELQNYLQHYGIKPSVQRIAILEYLHTHATHPTAEEIYVALHPTMPTLSKTTVYNTLKLLARHGAILLLDIDGETAHFDGDIRPHAHFLCHQCRHIWDLPLAVAPEALLLDELELFQVDDIQLYYKGLCRACQQKID